MRPHHPATEERALALSVVKPKPCEETGRSALGFGGLGKDSAYLDESRHVSRERSGSSNERDGEENVRPDARVGKGGQDLGDGDLLARLGLVGIVVDDASGEDVALALGEVGQVEEERARVEGRAREEEDEQEGDEDGKQSFN